MSVWRCYCFLPPLRAAALMPSELHVFSHNILYRFTHEVTHWVCVFLWTNVCFCVCVVVPAGSSIAISVNVCFSSIDVSLAWINQVWLSWKPAEELCVCVQFMLNILVHLSWFTIFYCNTHFSNITLALQYKETMFTNGKSYLVWDGVRSIIETKQKTIPRIHRLGLS